MHTETCQERAARETAHAGPAANFNRASAGYTWETLMAMLSNLPHSELYTAHPGNRSSDTVIGHRDNHLPEHAGRVRAAAARLRSYGLRVRLARGAKSLTVYGPRDGGSDGRYSE